MNIKKLNEELKKLVISESEKLFNEFKNVYPDPIEEDLTSEYLYDIVDILEPILKEDELKKYKDNVKVTFNVSYPMDTVGYVRILIYGSYFNESILKGEISLQTRSDSEKGDQAHMEVFAGFLHNPIGQIKHRWTLNNPRSILYDQERLVKNLINEMADAMKASKRADQAYIDYVARTGDLS